ncbi:hypothetical protein GCM10025770_03520 [Viridibacterium curvum]|uniref:Uncharacterized protein n=1 Tax=Viridibacterium curvum TaxID=1101404 RepID=A0ABP9Q8R3_9RHOO
MQRKSRIAFICGLTGLIVSIPVYAYATPLWLATSRLEGAAFSLAALGFGLLLVAGPLLAIGGLLTALFMRTESIFLKRSHASRGDRPLLALAALVTALPALLACYPPLKALSTGQIRYKFPATEVSQHFDPLGYWQGIAFWFMGATALGWLAFAFWRSRWRKHKALRQPG